LFFLGKFVIALVLFSSNLFTVVIASDNVLLEEVEEALKTLEDCGAKCSVKQEEEKKRKISSTHHRYKAPWQFATWRSLCRRPPSL